MGNPFGAIVDAYNAADDWVKGQNQEINQSLQGTPISAMAQKAPSFIRNPADQAAYGADYVRTHPKQVGYGGDPNVLAAAQKALANAATSSSDVPNARGRYPYNPIYHYIRQGHPGMTRNQAKDLFDQYNTSLNNPGLSDFINQRTGTPDANSMQLFYGQTIAPMLAQANAQYMQGANAGTAAMQKIIAGSTGSPALDVLKSYIPVQQAGAQQMSAALQAGTVAGPYLDQLMTQLQNTQQAQQQAHADEQARNAALLYGGGSSSSGSSNNLAASLGLKIPKAKGT